MRIYESEVQKQIRLDIARAGAYSWRNNVGATPSKCPNCGEKFRPIRYGLANDSPTVNSGFKSGDLILAIPRIIQPYHVGTTIAQFGSVECKPPGWRYTGAGGEPQQAAWNKLIESIGGYAQFCTGDIKL